MTKYQRLTQGLISKWAHKGHTPFADKNNIVSIYSYYILLYYLLLVITRAREVLLALDFAYLLFVV